MNKLKERREELRLTQKQVAENGNDMILINNLAIIMAKKKIKITALSRLTGISRTTLTAIYYNREKTISYNVLGRICKVLDCSVGEIIVSK